MNQSAIKHSGVYPDSYLRDRSTLVLTLHTGKKDVKNCNLIIFSRTSVEDKNVVRMKCRLRDGLCDHFEAEVKSVEPIRYQKYYFHIVDNKNEEYYFSANGVSNSAPQDGFYEFLYANQTEIVKEPEWSRGQVFYQIFPERFCNGDEGINPPECKQWGTLPNRENYMGGDLSGIVSKIDYLEELGVDCLYLTPIFLGDFNHKYATTDYFEIDPQFGTKETFRELVRKLHARNMRIVLDGVFNHCGVNFMAFQDLLEKQEQSSYRKWFYIKSFPVQVSETNPSYECVGDYGYMPKLNTANPEVRNYILNVMQYWIENFQIDGWRLDVADEVDESVWLFARRKLKDSYPNKILLGETWGSGLRLMSGNQMDSIMNYVFRDAVVDFFAKDKIDAYTFNHRICRMLSHYPDEVNQSMYLPIGSHDTDRFKFLCNESTEKLKLAALFQICFVGAPAIYYGDEVGMTGDNDPGCRGCMIWDKDKQDTKLKEYYQFLLGLRKKETSIKTGAYAVNLCEGRVYGFVRYLDDEEIYVICNTGNECMTVELPVFYKTEYIELYTKEEFIAQDKGNKEYYNDDIHNYQGIIKMTLGTNEGKIIKRRR